MKVGYLGDIIFEVSSDKVQTFDKVNVDGSATFKSHDRYKSKPLTEFTGISTEKIDMKILLSRSLGSNVTAEVSRIKEYMNKAKILQLNLGNTQIGDKWVINSYKVSYTDFDYSGNPISADVSIKLIEYSR